MRGTSPLRRAAGGKKTSHRSRRLTPRENGAPLIGEPFLKEAPLKGRWTWGRSGAYLRRAGTCWRTWAAGPYPGLAGDGAGYRGSRLVILTPESWEKAEGAWPLMQDAPVPEAKTGYAALGSYPDNYGAAAQEAGCPAYCEAQDGFVRFYARAKPSGDIWVQVTLLGNAGGTVVTGLVAGSGVRVDPTLTISGAAADAAATGVRIKLLELVQGMDVSGISFVSAFDTLDGVELTGVWNKAASRVEF